jgi:hypothetical protein
VVVVFPNGDTHKLGEVQSILPIREVKQLLAKKSGAPALRQQLWLEVDERPEPRQLSDAETVRQALEYSSVNALEAMPAELQLRVWIKEHESKEQILEQLSHPDVQVVETSNAVLNGCCGCVFKFDRVKQRYAVKVDGRLLALKPENIESIATPETVLKSRLDAFNDNWEEWGSDKCIWWASSDLANEQTCFKHNLAVLVHFVEKKQGGASSPVEWRHSDFDECTPLLIVFALGDSMSGMYWATLVLLKARADPNAVASASTMGGMASLHLFCQNQAVLCSLANDKESREHQHAIDVLQSLLAHGARAAAVTSTAYQNGRDHYPAGSTALQMAEIRLSRGLSSERAEFKSTDDVLAVLAVLRASLAQPGAV